LAKYVNGATTLLQSRTLADLANDGITPDVNDMDLRLVMKGSSLEVMVNDNSIFTVTDSSISSGKYGLWSNQTAYFDKVIMRISETRDGTYKIYRSTQPDTGYTLIKSGATGTSYTDNALTAGVKYYYKVKGVDASGNTSVGFSNIAPRK
jgi:fibronectin type 3 domain-containing protein